VVHVETGDEKGEWYLVFGMSENTNFDIIRNKVEKDEASDLEYCIYVTWDSLVGYETYAFSAADDLSTLQKRVEAADKENKRKAFRLEWIKDNYGDNTALRFALEADDTEIDEKMAAE